ncbi:SDR family oxidoreductase [Streptomyces sp. 061-3]|uniref:SDR family oxidoreductase n=1 Tax=Streptomyces sp. 061-3 TaxID=2789268 RepID=UPI0039803618
MAIMSAVTAALPALAAHLALELASIRVNLIAAGFLDTPLSASLLGDQLDARREELRATLPIRRVVVPAAVAALAVHIMCNDALTGGTYDVDVGQHSPTDLPGRSISGTAGEMTRGQGIRSAPGGRRVADTAPPGPRAALPGPAC